MKNFRGFNVISMLMYLPLGAGIASYLLALAMLWYFNHFVSAVSRENIGPGILFINSFYVYTIGLMLCLFTAIVKKSYKLAMLFFLLPLIIFLVTIRLYQRSQDRIVYPVPVEDFLFR